MTASHDPPGSYRVSMIGSAEAAYLELVRQAAEAGEEEPLTSALTAVGLRLRTDPREFGEPMYHLRAMRMEVRKASVRPLYVEYGVHDDKPVVVIRFVAGLTVPPVG